MAFKIFRVVKSPLEYLRSKQPATKRVKTLARYIILTNNAFFGPCNEMFCYLPPHPEEKRNNNNNDKSNNDSRYDNNTGKEKNWQNQHVLLA